MHVPNKDDYLAAASKKPKDRSSSDWDLVNRGQNMQDVRNADAEARRQQSIHG